MEEQTERYRVYKRRWIVLALYALYCTVNAVQWLQYSIIADVIIEYYQVSYTAVNWTSIIYMLAYVVTILPGTWFFNKTGIRPSILLATGGTCIGSWIKVASVAQDRFWVTFLGQTVVALSQVYAFSIATPLAATWFGPTQVSTACAIGVLGLMLGNALGMWMPTAIVPPIDSGLQKVGAGLSNMFYINAIASSIIFALQLLFLKSKPPTPPSQAEASRKNSNATIKEFVVSIWELLKDPNYLLLFFNFSINAGAFSTIATFLNQMILNHYPNGQNDAGNIGLIFILSGMVGMIAIGVFLDITKRYKETVFGLFLISTLLMIAYTFSLPSNSMIFVYVISTINGPFLVGYMPAAYELAVEVTYPMPEASSSGCMSLGGQIFSVIMSVVYGVIITEYGDVASNLFVNAALVVGTILAFFIKSDLRRQGAVN